ncbi:MAG: alpha/beta hydrolase [Chitinophagaceae bacterium]|nr:alpha/beta hydrolase [Chitinophagaceae bacterium]
MKRNKKRISLLLPVLLISLVHAEAQSSPVQNIFPAGTIVHSNLPYANDNHKKHLLDIYLPAGENAKRPLVVWIHGGAWMLNDKYADMGYMKNTVKGFIDNGYALASIDYRYSTEAVFPAQAQDCNQALEYLYQHAEQYGIDREKIAVIGFSAGGHLASLLALSNNNAVKEFYPSGREIHFKIKCVLDFYGPSDFIMLAGSPDTSINNERNPVAILLGAMPLKRPDLAKIASPVTYVDKDDPPFLIVQGEKDESVPNTQSKMLSSWLTLTGVKNELIVVPNAPHYGEMFDEMKIRKSLFRFLDSYLK